MVVTRRRNNCQNPSIHLRARLRSRADLVVQAGSARSAGNAKRRRRTSPSAFATRARRSRGIDSYVRNLHTARSRTGTSSSCPHGLSGSASRCWGGGTRGGERGSTTARCASFHLRHLHATASASSRRKPGEQRRAARANSAARSAAAAARAAAAAVAAARARRASASRRSRSCCCLCHRK